MAPSPSSHTFWIETTNMLAMQELSTVPSRIGWLDFTDVLVVLVRWHGEGMCSSRGPGEHKSHDLERRQSHWHQQVRHWKLILNCVRSILSSSPLILSNRLLLSEKKMLSLLLFDVTNLLHMAWVRRKTQPFICSAGRIDQDASHMAFLKSRVPCRMAGSLGSNSMSLLNIWKFK